MAHPHHAIGARIAIARLQAGIERGERITQADVAEAVGVKQHTVTQWEIGRRRPEPDALERVADYLGTHPAALLHGPILPERLPRSQAEKAQAWDRVVELVAGMQAD